MEKFSESLENIPDEYSRKIRSYLNNIGKAVKKSKKIFVQEEVIKEKLDNVRTRTSKII